MRPEPLELTNEHSLRAAWTPREEGGEGVRARRGRGRAHADTRTAVGLPLYQRHDHIVGLLVAQERV